MPATNGRPRSGPGGGSLRVLPRWLRWLVPALLVLAFLGLRLAAPDAAADNALCLALVIQLYLLIPGPR